MWTPSLLFLFMTMHLVIEIGDIGIEIEKEEIEEEMKTNFVREEVGREKERKEEEVEDI